MLAQLDPNGAAVYDPLGDAPPPGPLPQHAAERTRLALAHARLTRSLAETRRALQGVLAVPEVRRLGMAQQPPWWRQAWAALGHQADEDADPAYHTEASG